MDNFFLDYAITVSVLSKSILDKDYQKRINKKYYDQLTVKEQNDYLEYILQLVIKISKNYEGNDFKQFFTFEFETHHNIFLKGGATKQHLHGTFYHCTKEDIATYKATLTKILRVYRENEINKCICIVPIYYDKGWTNYCKKDQTVRDLELDLLEIQNDSNNPLDN